MVYHLHRQQQASMSHQWGRSSETSLPQCVTDVNNLEFFSYECLAAVFLPVTGVNPNTPANA